MKRSIQLANTSTYDTANAAYRACHDAMLAQGYKATKQEVAHMPGKFTYTYRKNGEPSLALRREPGSAQWVVARLIMGDRRLTVYYMDDGQLPLEKAQ